MTLYLMLLVVGAGLISLHMDTASGSAIRPSCRKCPCPLLGCMPCFLRCQGPPFCNQCLRCPGPATPEQLPEVHQEKRNAPHIQTPDVLPDVDPRFELPGDIDPGFEFPGDIDPGFEFTGDIDPGFEFPGDIDPGFEFPGDVDPGFDLDGPVNIPPLEGCCPRKCPKGCPKCPPCPRREGNCCGCPIVED